MSGNNGASKCWCCSASRSRSFSSSWQNSAGASTPVCSDSVWSAYMLADATAIYVLGHMSVTNSTSGEHELMAFWAPFLLLHLGGQDNITAYAVEDNQLWLRHLQTLAVQVASAGYVLFESPIVGSGSLLRPATVVMFVVGVLKYGERVWALWCASSSPSGSNYRSLDRLTASAFGLPSSPSLQNPRPQDREAFLLIAHRLLDAPMDLLKGPSTFLAVHYGTLLIHGEDLYKVAEMQLSLMHDVFYTKADVTHSWYGLCVRVVSLLGTAASLLLFHLHLVGRRHRQHPSKDDDGHSSVDAVISYVLLLGAILLEITWALSVGPRSRRTPARTNGGAASLERDHRGWKREVDRLFSLRQLAQPFADALLVNITILIRFPRHTTQLHDVLHFRRRVRHARHALAWRGERPRCGHGVDRVHSPICP